MFFSSGEGRGKTYGAAALVTAYLGSGQIGRRKKILCESSQISFAIQVEHF